MKRQTTSTAAANAKSGRKSTSQSFADRARKQPLQDESEEYLSAFAARNRFITYTFGLGWRLAITVIVPLFIGVKLDDHFHSTPSYTLAAFFVAIFISGIIVWDTVKDLRVQQDEEDEEEKKADAVKTTVKHYDDEGDDDV